MQPAIVKLHSATLWLPLCEFDMLAGADARENGEIMTNVDRAVGQLNQQLNQQLNHHMNHILACTVPSDRNGRLLLATPPNARYPYIYPRDMACASQLFRRISCSRKGYEVADTAFDLLRSSASFLKAVQSETGAWGQRYGVDGGDKSIYKQEDNLAHGISVVCNYLLAAARREETVESLDDYLGTLNRALSYSLKHIYQKEINLFRSTTAIHESAMEEGYTCWVNFSFLYAFSLASEVAQRLDSKGIVAEKHMQFRDSFLHSVSELFMAGSRYIRRLDPEGNMDLRPDFTLLSPFYYGFLHYKDEMDASVEFIEKQLWDPTFGMILRYLPFYKDFANHIHAGSGPWIQYTSILAQYHFWKGNTERGDELLANIDRYAGPNGELPEHLSTCERFADFMEAEWSSGVDFAKEFHKPLLLDNVDFDRILEEVNNMSRSYAETGSRCMIADASKEEGGYIQFSMPLMWSHVEYSKALLFRNRDWWRMR